MNRCEVKYIRFHNFVWQWPPIEHSEKKYPINIQFYRFSKAKKRGVVYGFFDNSNTPLAASKNANAISSS